MYEELIVNMVILSIPLSIITYTVITFSLKNDKNIKGIYAITILSSSGLSSLIVETVTTGFCITKIPLEETLPLFLILYTTQFYILDKLIKTIKKSFLVK